MSWELDIPNLPFKKPSAIETLEKLGFSQREAMDPIEMGTHIQEVAYSLADAYHRKWNKGEYDTCMAIIISALKELGASFGGNFGATMVANSESAAEEATQAFFAVPEE